ncbi:hypothetical protein ACFZBU_40220 [Embleya sp. NPDC008237]|uniref:hypothetical protein n=1 Tax=Embleya sp. NPDC008237 TaxID=3363978 RepID=UPI0036E29A05
MVVDAVGGTGHDAEDRRNPFAVVDAVRIPVEYLAELFTAGDPAPVDAVPRRPATMPGCMRDINVGCEPDAAILRPRQQGRRVDAHDMYRLLAPATPGTSAVVPLVSGLRVTFTRRTTSTVRSGPIPTIKRTAAHRTYKGGT